MAYEVIYLDVSGSGGGGIKTDKIEADDYFIDGTYTTFTNDTVRVRSLPTTSIHDIKKV